MSYGRNPHYIWSDGEYLNFEPYGKIPEHVINAFLYKILLRSFRDELKERLREGKKEWMYQLKYNAEECKLIELPQEPEYIEWMEANEDEIFKSLYGQEK
jgi:hypothetical protein